MDKIEYRLSHIHLKVKSTKADVAKLRQAGFTIEFGHKGIISPNAFIFFNDNVFIEIYTMSGPANLSPPFMDKSYGKQMGDRFRFWGKAPQGFTDFAFEPCDPKISAIDNFDNVRQSLIDEGFDMSKNMVSSRTNIRNEKVGFGFCSLSPIELPFLVTSYSIKQIPDHIEHSNGIDHIHCMEVTCSERDMDSMKRLVGTDPKVKLISGEKTEISKVIFASKKSGFKPPNIQGLFGMKVGFVTEK